MKKTALALCLAALSTAAGQAGAQDMPMPAPPVEQHQWLQQLVGEWTTDSEVMMAPGQPPMKCSGTESVRALGGYWIVADGAGTVMEMPVSSVMALGYDPKKGKFVGSWVGSMSSDFWVYEGSLDESGKILTLDTEGPSMVDPGKSTKYKDVIEIKSADHRMLSSSMQEENGEWVTFVTVNYRRKS